MQFDKVFLKSLFSINFRLTKEFQDHTEISLIVFIQFALMLTSHNHGAFIKTKSLTLVLCY